MPEIIMDIDVDGSVTIKVNGVAGKSCKALTADLEKALGKVVKDTETPEYYQQEKIKVTNKA